ncbi:MAG: esterase-like activity of phytase family protein [Actinocatenispora sp.]
MRIRAALAASLTALGLGVAGSAFALPATAGPAGHHPGDLGACSPSVSLVAYDDELDGASFQGEDIGGLSAFAHDGHHILALSDRSTLWTMSVRTGAHLSAKPLGFQPIKDEQGQPLDDEALVVDRDGTRLVTSEAEPSIRRFDRDGTVLSRLPVPDRFQAQPAGEADPNGSFEGMTMLPGGHSLVASMEEPLSGDGTDADGNGLVRFLRWDRPRHGEFELARQYAFTVDAGLGISEVQAVSPTKLLVLERGYTSGYGNTIRLYEADLAGASDVTDVPSLKDAHVRQARRTLLADLVKCPTAGATNKETQANPLLDNIEGMTLTGRRLPGGRQELMLVSDNNFSADGQTTRLYSLAVRVH